MVCKVYPDTAVGGRGKTGGERGGGGGTSNSKKEDNHNWGGEKPEMEYLDPQNWYSHSGSSSTGISV